MSGQTDDDKKEPSVTDETQQEPTVEPTVEPKPEPTPEVKPEPKRRGPNKPKSPEKPVPAIGRIVHYVTASGTIRPAIITAVSEVAVDLTVFNSQGAVPANKVTFDNELPGETPGTAFWPEHN